MVFCYLQAYGYSKIGITLCPSEWYEYLNFWYLAHGLTQLKRQEARVERVEPEIINSAGVLNFE